MGLIARIIKAGSGTKDWIGGAGKKILAAEANADLNTVFGEVSGNIDNTNVKAGAGIVYSKLSLTASIVDGDVSAAANINGSKLLDGSVLAAKIGPLNIDTAQLAANAVSKAVAALANNALVLATNAVWTDIATPQIVGHVLASAPASGLLMQFSGAVRLTQAGSINSGDTVGLMLRLMSRVGGVDTVRATYLAAFHEFFTQEEPPATNLQDPVPVNLTVLVTGLPAATYDFKVQYYLFSAGIGAPQFTLSPAVAGMPSNPERHLVVVPLFK